MEITEFILIYLCLFQLKNYKNKRNLFEMMLHYKPNQLLYEQVIYHLLGLVGVGSALERSSFRKLGADVEQMVSAEKNIVLEATTCGELPCSETCAPLKCGLCLPCVSRTEKEDLHMAFREHEARGETKQDPLHAATNCGRGGNSSSEEFVVV